MALTAVTVEPEATFVADVVNGYAYECVHVGGHAYLDDEDDDAHPMNHWRLPMYNSC